MDSRFVMCFGEASELWKARLVGEINKHFAFALMTPYLFIYLFQTPHDLIVTVLPSSQRLAFFLGRIQH